jgi:hypothetical protein
MNGPEHYREAEKILELTSLEDHYRNYHLQAAQVHATLALAAATALEDGLRDALERISALEAQTPQARQLQLEADLAAADLAGSGYAGDYGPPVGAGRHGLGCQCPYCTTDEPEETAS